MDCVIEFEFVSMAVLAMQARYFTVIITGLQKYYYLSGCTNNLYYENKINFIRAVMHFRAFCRRFV